MGYVTVSQTYNNTSAMRTSNLVKRQGLIKILLVLVKQAHYTSITHSLFSVIMTPCRQ